MLPDFLKTKEKLKKMLDSERKKAELLHLGPVADAPKSMIFEGNRFIIVYEDGSCKEVKMEKATSRLEVKWEEVETMTHETVLNKIDGVAKEMAEQIKKSFYGTLSEAAEETGNVGSTHGEPLTIDVLLDMLEKMHVSFDEEGNPSGLTFAGSSKLRPVLAEIISQAESDPRYQALMEQKREEWRVRESRRKLVG